MLTFACLVNLEFSKIFEATICKGLYDYTLSGKKSILFGTSNNTPMKWTLNFILPKGTTLLILYSFYNSNSGLLLVWLQLSNVQNQKTQ